MVGGIDSCEWHVLYVNHCYKTLVCMSPNKLHALSENFASMHAKTYVQIGQFWQLYLTLIV